MADVSDVNLRRSSPFRIEGMLERRELNNNKLDSTRASEAENVSHARTKLGFSRVDPLVTCSQPLRPIYRVFIGEQHGVSAGLNSINSTRVRSGS